MHYVTCNTVAKYVSNELKSFEKMRLLNLEEIEFNKMIVELFTHNILKPF